MNVAEAPEVAAIRALEDRRHEAMVDADFKVLGELLDDELIYTHSSGVREGKAQYLDHMRSGRVKYQKILRPEQDIRVEGSVAIVTGRLEMTALVEGESKHLSAMWVDVWIKRVDAWRMLVWQSTRIAARH